MKKLLQIAPILFCAALLISNNPQNTWASARQRKKSKYMYGQGDYVRDLRFKLRKRFYEIHIPPQYDKSKPIPAVLLFHGGGGHPAAVRYETGMDSVADREGFIAIYPAGINNKLLLRDRLLLWNDGRPHKDGSYSKVDDVGFVNAVLDDASRLFSIDQRRVYAAGFSNGAQFTYRLANQLSNRIAAIAAVAGQRAVDELFSSPARPISIMQFSGLKDTVGPYYGGSPTFGEAEFKTNLKSITETIPSWVKFNGCPQEPSSVKRIGNAVETRYGPGKDNTEVILWTLEDGGHTWPGGKVMPNVEKLGLDKMGNVNQDINASDLIWDFFKRHSSR